MKQSDNSALAALGLVGAITIVPLIMLANALSVYLLWGWFAVPLLDVDPVNLFGAFGLALLVGALVGPNHHESKDKSAARIFGEALLRPAVAITLGWAAHFFI